MCILITIKFQTNLTIDWDHTPAEYTCYGHKIIPSNIMPRIYCENIPKTYKVKIFYMSLSCTGVIYIWLDTLIRTAAH